MQSYSKRISLSTPSLIFRCQCWKHCEIFYFVFYFRTWFLCKCYFGWYDNNKCVLNCVNFCTRHISWTKENCRRETKWRNKRFAFQEKVGEIHLIIKSVLNCVNVRTSYISWTKEISKKEEEMKEWKMCITRKDMRNSSNILNINNVIETNWN